MGEDVGASGGLLSPLSHINASFDTLNRRSLHKNFALSSSLRPNEIDNGKLSKLNTIRLMMEGMSIRYEPKTCVGTFVNQSFSDLTRINAGGAGSYWKLLLESNNINSNSSVVSLLSNS